MNDETITYSLEFAEFSIDFDVKRNASIERTRSFDSHGPDFVFAVADTWLRIGHSRHLLISEFNSGNLIETLRGLEKQLGNLISTPDIGKVIPRGGLGVWMYGYWNRLNLDCSVPDDEVIYGLLFPLCISAHNDDYIAAYRYNGMPTIEVTTRPRTEEKPIHVWSEFDAEKMVCEVRELRQSIETRLNASQNGPGSN